jgi:small subunit ribosomal protein S8e
MGVSRDVLHKRRASGARRKAIRVNRKYELGRPAAMTKLAPRRVTVVRTRGGNTKFRALRLDTGNFSWGTEAITRKTRLLNVMYNASNNELVRTNTLVKNCIVQIDATPFRQWYRQHYGLDLGVKGEAKAVDTKTPENRQKKHANRLKANGPVAAALKDQFAAGRLLACISSRPGQHGRADGYILEGPELDFYHKKLAKKKKN